MTVKGQEFPAYDPRGIQGMGLTYATSNRGACHLRGYTVASEVLGIPEKTDPLVTDGKAGLVKAFQDATAAVDSAGLCVFTTFAWTLDDIAPQIDAACEGDWDADSLVEVGERIWNLEREFNLKAGITAEDDTLPGTPAQGGGQDRPGQGQGQRARQDAAGVLRAARLERGGGADGGDPRRVSDCRRRRLEGRGPRRISSRPRTSSLATRSFSPPRESHHASRRNRRRPRRRHRLRNPAPARCGGPDHPDRRRARAALLAHGHSLLPDRQDRRAGHPPASPTRTSTRSIASRSRRALVEQVDARDHTLRLGDGGDAGLRSAPDRHRLQPRHCRRYPASNPTASCPAGPWRTPAGSTRARSRAARSCCSVLDSSAASSWRPWRSGEWTSP